MYGEHLKDAEYGHYDDDGGGAAPAAFAAQDNYDIEMDRYRAQSQINSHSHGAVGAQAAQNGFNDAVFLGDDANSVEDLQSIELDNNKELPNMGNHQYYRSGSVRDVDSPRDNWAANPNAPNPTQGLNCLWVIITICIMAAIACATTIDNSMVNIFIDMDQYGTFVWNLGWNAGKFSWRENAAESANDFNADAASSITEDQFPIPNTLLYMKNAGYLLMSTILIVLCLMAYILMILCSRCNSHVLLYINCCCCRIPQRASVYFAFDIIKTFSWATTMYYIVLGIYGLLETNFYLTTQCPGGNTCWSYIIPHYGFFSLMCITFSISCCAFSKVQALDVKFNLKSMQLYYPENLRKAESRNCSLKLDMLFACIAAMKNICILAFIMFVAFRDVGLISIVFYNETDSTNTNAVMFFQFQGLTNTHGIAENSCLEEEACSGTSGSDDNNIGSTLTPIVDDLESKSSGFATISRFWDYWICCILFINLFVFIPYIWSVILRYSSFGFCKFMIVLITFIEWLVFTILLILYYYEYYAFFHNSAKGQLEYEMLYYTGSEYNITWFPDWGIFVAIILWFYMLRLMYAAFKAM